MSYVSAIVCLHLPQSVHVVVPCRAVATVTIVLLQNTQTQTDRTCSPGQDLQPGTGPAARDRTCSPGQDRADRRGRRCRHSPGSFEWGTWLWSLGSACACVLAPHVLCGGEGGTQSGRQVESTHTTHHSLTHRSVFREDMLPKLASLLREVWQAKQRPRKQKSSATISRAPTTTTAMPQSGTTGQRGSVRGEGCEGCEGWEV